MMHQRRVVSSKHREMVGRHGRWNRPTMRCGFPLGLPRWKRQLSATKGVSFIAPESAAELGRPGDSGGSVRWVGRCSDSVSIRSGQARG